MQYLASDFRTMARQTLKGQWWNAILVTLVASFLGAATVTVSVVEFKFESGNGLVMDLCGKTFPLLHVGTLSMIFAIVFLVWSIIKLIIGGAMSLGYCQYHINLVKKQRGDIKTLFVHKDKLWHGFCINFWMVLYTFLWTLCLVVPGIMAGYSYAMAYYVANDHPEMTAREVLTASKEMMHGHRWRLFCLDVSFLGWLIVGGLTLGIGSYAVAPYYESAQAHFYQDLLNHGMRLEDSILGENDFDENRTI